MKISLAILLIALLAFTVRGDNKCRALALEGGGDKGAYQAAVFDSLVKNLPKEDVAYDVVTGVSVGAINGAGIATFAPGEEVEAADFIMDVWSNIKKDSLYDQWTGGYIQGALFEKGILNNKKMITFLEKTIAGRQLKKRITVASGDANTADYVEHNHNKSTKIPLSFFEDVTASASMPFVFPYQPRGKQTLIDGGAIWNVNIPAAVKRCRETGKKDKDIIVDVILCSQSNLMKKNDVRSYNTFQNLYRAIEILMFHGSVSDVEKTMLAYPNVKFRYVIGPSENLPSGFIPLSFAPKEIKNMFEIGKKDA